ncbi:MAG: 1-acyl-sn-glycerol-3-phosphate acyltransferase, partial [Patescibacteria group bacterium]|nr:1-acyl-sn-glycerol-3-phosphate acyltransferase [Patescibacteria group bacterium]
ETATAVSQTAVIRSRLAQARRERFINEFARLTQFVTWPALWVVINTLFRLDIHNRQSFSRARQPFIIISNHISFYDCFLYRLVLGAFTPHLPLRFMAVRKFNWKFLNFLASIGLIDFIYSLFGVFTVVPGRGVGRNLREALDILNVGGNVVIYPEGKITVEGRVGEFKKGAAVLARQTGVQVVPVSFRDWGGFWRRKIVVHVGEPMTAEPSRSIADITHSFHRAVSDLYDAK